MRAPHPRNGSRFPHIIHGCHHIRPFGPRQRDARRIISTIGGSVLPTSKQFQLRPRFLSLPPIEASRPAQGGLGQEEFGLKDRPRGTRGSTNAEEAAASALPEVRFAFPGPTLLLSFTATLPTIPTSTMMYFYYDALLVLLLTAPVTLFVAAPVTSGYCCLLLLTTKAAAPGPAARPKSGNALRPSKGGPANYQGLRGCRKTSDWKIREAEFQ